MAKQVVNPIERHVEKALLGLAGIALIAVIVMYVVRSPNQLEIGGDMVTPGEIDAKLAWIPGNARCGSFQAKTQHNIWIPTIFTGGCTCQRSDEPSWRTSPGTPCGIPLAAGWP